jgi:EmrB/QacA subfamily drug resistance transporter
MTTAASSKYHTSGIVPLTKPQLIGTMTGLLLALLLAALDQTIVGTAEPRIIAQLSGFDRYPWVATAYLLSSTIAVPIFARLSDLYGRKWFFLSGAVVFVSASALCGAAGEFTSLPLDGMNQLILFRGLQGIGAGITMGLVFTIIGDIFSPAERGHYQGLFSAVWGLASIFGPTLGGWLTDHVSWRACFYVNLPVGALAITAIYFQFPAMHPEGVRRILDWAGIGTLIACIVPLLLAFTWVTEYGWGSPRVEYLLAFAAIMLVAFLFAEIKAPEPLLPLSMFKLPVIALCSIAVFTLGMAMFGVIIYLPLYMQGVLGVSATQSGNLLTPLMMGAVFGTLCAGQISARLGVYKPSAIAGSFLVASGMTLFARMTTSTSRGEVLIGMVLAGLGMGLLNPTYTIAVQNVAPRNYMGAVTAAVTFFRSIGSTIGVAIFGTVLLTNYHRDFATAMPLSTPQAARAFFSNPLMLQQVRPQLDAMFTRIPNGASILQSLFASVRVALARGLHLIFLSSAVIMTLAILVHFALPGLPLRGRKPPEPPPEL